MVPQRGLQRSNSCDSLTSARTGFSSSCTSSYSYYSSSCYGYDPEVEELAAALRDRLLENKLVKEQSSALFKTKIPNAFVGRDAVTLLVELLQEKREQDANKTFRLPEDIQEEEDKGPVTREEALKVGNQIAKDFGFFKHAANEETPLQDSSSDFYQFHNNLPSEVLQVKKQHKTYWDKMRLLEQHVECKDRWYFPRVYQDCFVAKECVDVLMKLKLVRSRGEAVHLVRRLNQKVFCCQHVTSEHDFKDDYFFFRFVPKQERMPEPAKPNKTRMRRHLRKQTSMQSKLVIVEKEGEEIQSSSISPGPANDQQASNTDKTHLTDRNDHLHSSVSTSFANLDATELKYCPSSPLGSIEETSESHHGDELQHLSASSLLKSIDELSILPEDSTLPDEESKEDPLLSRHNKSVTNSTASSSKKCVIDSTSTSSKKKRMPRKSKSTLSSLPDQEPKEGSLLTRHNKSSATDTNTSTSSKKKKKLMPKSKSTGNLLSKKQKRANQRRADEIRARLADYHKERINTNKNSDTKHSSLDNPTIPENLQKGKQSLDMAKTQLLLPQRARPKPTTPRVC